MNVLDAKLNSIEGLSDVRVESSSASSAAAPVEHAASSSSAPVVAQEEPEEVAQASGGMKNKDDPRYYKYFKMLVIGVPLANVQNKMMMEGVDPSVLDDPDGLSGGEPVVDEVDFGSGSESEPEEWDD